MALTADNPVESLAQAVYTALAVDLLPNDQGRRPYQGDINCYHFQQTWGSTALGFGGMGGSAITQAYTTVIVCKQQAVVYFGGRKAYRVDQMNQNFADDLKNHRMASCKRAAERYTEEQLTEV
ncbi:hypothetical protein CLV58_109219 [Spirosoma oryzae]|uniref:Uncharacterized protein n=1 Tax=Spirosoma oryzae TaxID=1469603 RepID=A0A2T0SYJ7_9BACT|nr:hypothetical protein [Spirosoma oryzae]PRY38492.1 hypothetical protein CLV58_109219 [Spirosoma oryzae]